MPDDLYDRDILSWSEHQADLLRHLANGKRVNDVDWPHVIEEIADVGISELNAVRGLALQMAIHLIKLHLSLTDPARNHRRQELDAFSDGIAIRFAPSMRQRIDLPAIWDRAKQRAVRYFSENPDILALPETCPWTIDALVANDHDALLAALSPTAPGPA